ncbi:uncharacterized protein LOC132169326 [Corylus avellana]|uniref:uncharacterized protein LOC132169326 n=1 Tax=Corylus avellana TaxID=13451 RepID=UPI00286ADA73|nr:uncharacterized protein LOC132169326 [Corylus avellana]
MSVIEGSNELAIVPVPNQPSTESTHFSTPGHPHQPHRDQSNSSRSFPIHKHINMPKSAVLFSENFRSSSKASINEILNLAQIPARAKYLGIPLFMHRKKKDSFVELKDRKFWWGYPQEKKHNLSLLSWESVCKPKSLGGLGIRTMESLNNSLLARLGWKMTSNQSLLWVDSLRSKHLKNGISFLNAASNPSSSWLWKGLLKNRKVVEKGACISISSGLNVDIWSSPWIPLMPNFRPIHNANLDVCPSLTVADLIIPGEQISTSRFANRPISDWISTILSPMASFGITKPEVRKFQLFVALVMDFIWRARNLLIHDGLQPSSSQAIVQVSSSLNHHITAWRELDLPTLWVPPVVGYVKGNFDVAVKGSFAVVAAVISDDMRNIISVATQKLNSTDVLQGEASVALLAARLVVSSGCDKLMLEGDALLVVLAINNPSLFSSWTFANCIYNISLVLSSFQSWNALKVSRCANFRALALTKWVTSNLVF